MLHSIGDIAVGIAAILAILDYFGIKPKGIPQWRTMPLNRKWKLTIMLGLVSAALGMSGYNFYRSLHPKIVERVIEKPVVVEKTIEKTIPCPSPPKPTKTKTTQPQGPIVEAPNATQKSSGYCSPNQIGINNTNNCVIPPRVLSAEQQAHLVQYLSSAKYKISIGSLIGDEEAGEFATALADTFERAGWEVDRVIGREMQSGTSAESVTIRMYAPTGATSSDNKAALMVANAFIGVGIKFVPNPDSTLPPDSVSVYVGTRRMDKP